MLAEFRGRYYFDENIGHGFTQALTRYTTEIPQTWIGYNFTQIRNTCGYVDRVDYLGGTTFATNEENEEKGSWGVTIGNSINISLYGKIKENFKEYITHKQLYMHEYGHTIQSQLLGMSYLLFIGLPSLISAANSEDIPDDPYYASTHDYFFSETWANCIAARYFHKHYNYEWDEIRYPFHDYR